MANVGFISRFEKFGWPMYVLFAGNVADVVYCETHFKRLSVTSLGHIW